ncbi:MAG TPA: DbpA RNA binding domain-containing protein, partial [Gemmatimonadaceae bacterium]|nr:DbpA RNA binding domain-containing protein [Gemmatimonadaceae bacterium]
MEQDESGVARSQHVVHVLPPGDARVAGVVAPQVMRADENVGEVQVLVLTPSPETAAWIARLVNPTLAQGEALLVPVTAPARAARRVSAGARAVAATPADALALVRGSSLKLEGVTSLALVDANELLATASEAMATLLAEIPRDAERILIAREVDDEVNAFVEAHMRRARRITYEAPAATGGTLHYVVGPRGERATAIRSLLDRFDPPRATVLVPEPFQSTAARALASIGYAADDALVRMRTGGIDAHEPLVICFGAPPGVQELQELLSATPQMTAVLVAPDELAAFLRLAGGRATPLSMSGVPAAAHAAEDALRDELRAVMRARALHRETLTIEPLLAEHDAVEVAAAALRMLDVERERAKAKRPARAAEAPAVTPPAERVAPVGTAFTRLFINVGERDGARKGDFVGAITGEAGLSAEQIGKIELRDTFSIVEVGGEVAEKVIAALTGKTIRGRQVMAREDRGPTEREGGDRGEGRGFRGGDRGERGGFRGGDRGERGGFRGAGHGGARGGFRGGERGGERGGFRGGERGGERGGFRGGERGGERGG